MKTKTLLIATLTMLFAAPFAGCSDDDDEDVVSSKLTLNEDAIILTHNDTTALSVSGNEVVEWSTTDQFIATVDEDGVVTGHHVGATIVEAKTADGRTAECGVAVVPMYFTFKEPYIEWGKSQADVLAGQDFAKDCTQDGTEVSSSQSSGKMYSARYRIDPGKGLYYSEVQIKGEYELEIYKFLEERYQYLDTRDGVRYYVDSYSAETYETMIGCFRTKHYSKTYIVITYMSGDYLRSESK